MFKNIKNNKGFTLIELLAVIVILGILMIVAIPQVTKYIEQSKKDTFVDTAKAYINAARYAYLNDEISTSSGESCTLGDNVQIPISELDVDNSGKSSFGGALTGYVTIIANGDTTNNAGETKYEYEYYITLSDSKGWDLIGKETDLNRKSVKKTKKNRKGNSIICGTTVTAPSDMTTSS